MSSATAINSILIEKINRLAISEDEKNRVLAEVNSMDEQKQQKFLDLLEKHDLEAIKVLNQKSKKKNVLKKELYEILSGEKVLKGEKIDLQALLKPLFFNTAKMAEFLALVDDATIVQLEELIKISLKDQPEAILAFHAFFTEARLHKVAFENKAKKQFDLMLQEKTEKAKKDTSELDQLIQQAKKLL